ncbi:MAG: hypothetical protein QM768_19010 [Agriterribacter sp.]
MVSAGTDVISNILLTLTSPGRAQISRFHIIRSLYGQTFNQGWYYIRYLIEKKEYMALCENKFKPQMHCNGKCELAKKIKEQGEKEKQQAPEMKLAKSEVLSLYSFFPRFLPSLLSTEKHFYDIAGSGMPVDRSISLLRPPGAYSVI